MAHSSKQRDKMTEEEFIRQYDPGAYERLSASADVVVFSVDSEAQSQNYRKLDKQKLTVLLAKRSEHPCMGKWSVPGGFVGIDEALDAAAVRILRNKTGLAELYMEQLYTFGNPGRDPRMRIISCAYLSLIDRSRHPIKSNHQLSGLEWFEVELPKGKDFLLLKSSGEEIVIPIQTQAVQNGKIKTNVHSVGAHSALAFDHASLILEGLLRLRGKLEYTDLAFNLLPERFTVAQLQQVYEIILGQELLSPAFRRKIADKITETGVYTSEKGHRPSQYYTYNGGMK